MAKAPISSRMIIEDGLPSRTWANWFSKTYATKAPLTSRIVNQNSLIATPAWATWFTKIASIKPPIATPVVRREDLRVTHTWANWFAKI